VSQRVVLYAEGPGDSGGEVRLLPEYGAALGDSHLGAAHHLVRRIIAEILPCPPEAITFTAPLRTSRGRYARGSDLLVPAILRRLVAFPPTPRRPDLAIVLIDEDGDRSRRELAKCMEAGTVPAALGVPAPEFEAWLLCDQRCLCEQLNAAVDLPPDPDSMMPGQAKALLQRAVAPGEAEGRWGDAARRIAENLDLELALRVRSFERFVKDLRSCLRKT
jgi:hypothetical protein